MTIDFRALEVVHAGQVSQIYPRSSQEGYSLKGPL